MMSPHGIPVDLLDRLVIIRTLQYVLEEIIAILNTRAKVCLHINRCSFFKHQLHALPRVETSAFFFLLHAPPSCVWYAGDGQPIHLPCNPLRALPPPVPPPPPQG